MSSLKCTTIGGVVVSVADMVLGVGILLFYGALQHSRYHCQWSHGIAHCDYFVYATNHSVRTLVGIFSGIISLVFSGVLMLAFLKKLPFLAWIWLGKALFLVGINAYFISGWLYRQSWQFHNYYHPDEATEDSYFLLGGAAEMVLQLLIAFAFCTVAVPLTLKVKRNRKAAEAAQTHL